MVRRMLTLNKVILVVGLFITFAFLGLCILLAANGELLCGAVVAVMFLGQAFEGLLHIALPLLAVAAVGVILYFAYSKTKENLKLDHLENTRENGLALGVRYVQAARAEGLLDDAISLNLWKGGWAITDVKTVMSIADAASGQVS